VWHLDVAINPEESRLRGPSARRAVASPRRAITALDMSATEEYERIAKSIPPPQPRPPPAELQAEVSMRKPPAPAPGGGSWGVLRQKVKKGSAKAKGKGKSKKKTMLEVRMSPAPVQRAWTNQHTPWYAGTVLLHVNASV
jgi:hypothetical protein